jgi:hypothetical protein
MEYRQTEEKKLIVTGIPDAGGAAAPMMRGSAIAATLAPVSAAIREAHRYLAMNF